MINRVCGSCTACCKTHAVPLVGKEVGEYCQYCTVGQGCTIYPSRPIDCQVYKCWWLRGRGEEDDKPDKSGFVMDFVEVPGHDASLFIFWEFVPGAIGEPRVKQITDYLLEKRVVVGYNFAHPCSRSRFIFPDEMPQVERILFKLAFLKWSQSAPSP